jgi:formylglycine-generating enzyme required for sulfatase activity
MGGSDFDSTAEDFERPRQPVPVGSFWISKYEITQEQYFALTKKKPSVNKSKKEKNLPVDSVNWYEAKSFCEQFGALNSVPARLPSEKEWEYACRAGSLTRFYWGDDIDEACFWNDAIASNRSHPVGTKKPNAAGLCDMAGNVWEWCDDWFQAYPGGGTHPEFGETYKVLRGGGFTFDAFYCRSSFRGRSYPDSSNYATGFRVVIPAGTGGTP